MVRTGSVKKELVLFFVIAFGFTWAVSATLILSRLGAIHSLPLWLHGLTAYGPLIAGFSVEGFYRGKRGIGKYVNRLLNWKMGKKWFVISFVLLIIIFVISVILSYLITGENVNWDILGQLENAPKFGILGGLLFSLLNSGIGEEAGWRGFVLPRLQKKYNAFISTLILSGMWALWHLPFFLYVPNYMKWGLITFPGVVAGLILGGFILTWIYNGSKGNILAVVLWHGTFDFVTTTKGTPELAVFITCTIVILWGIAMPFIYKRESLSKEKRQVI